MPSIRASNKSRSKSVSKRTGRSKSPQPETKNKVVTKTTSKSTKSTPRGQPKKTDDRSEVRDKSTSKKVFTAAARQSTRGKIKPSANNEPASTSRSSPRKEQRASEKSAGRTTSRTPAKSPRKASVSKSKQAENAKASKASPAKRASRSSKGTQSPARTTKESVIYSSPQSRPKRRGLQSKQEARSPRTRNESKGSSPSSSPVKSRNTSAKLSKESPARPSRSTKRATTPKKSTGRVPSRKVSTAIETEDSKSKSPRKTTPKKAPTPKKSPAKVASKKPSVSKSEVAIPDVSIPDPVTGFKRDASGKLVKRVDAEAKKKEIKNNLGMLLEDDEVEVEIAIASKNMETEESESESESKSDSGSGSDFDFDFEASEVTSVKRGFSLNDDFRILAAALAYIAEMKSEKGLGGTQAWMDMKDPFAGDESKLCLDENDAKSKCKRYETALRFLRDEEVDKIADLCPKLFEEQLKKLRLVFKNDGSRGRHLDGIYKQLKEGRYYDKKLEMVLDAKKIKDYPEEEKERRLVEKQAIQGEAEEEEEEEIIARKSPRKKMRKNNGNESIVPRQVKKKVNKAEQKRLEEQEFKILKEDWQYETKSMTLNEVFRNRKSEGQFAFDINFTTYVDHTQGFRQFVEEEAEPEVENNVFSEGISDQNMYANLPVYAKLYGRPFAEVLTIFNGVSRDFKDLEVYLQKEDKNLLWTSQEDTDLIANNPIAMRYLIKIKGPLRIANRRKYLKQVGSI